MGQAVCQAKQCGSVIYRQPAILSLPAGEETKTPASL